MAKVITPDEMVKRAKKILEEHEYDSESIHSEWDDLCEEVLCSLGYEGAIEEIWEMFDGNGTSFWYS